MSLVTSALLSLATLLALAPSTAAATPVATPPDDDQIVGRVGGVDLTRSQYAEWLLERLGIDYLETWMREHAALQLAEAEGVPPTDEQIDATWDSEQARIIASFHKGDLSAFHKDIEGRGYSIESFTRLRKAQLRAEVALANVALARRSVSDEEVAARFDAMFGAEREVTSAQVLFFNMYKDVDPGTRPDPRTLKATAKARAEEALAAWSSGADFTLLQKDSDKLGSEFVSDGFIDIYRKDMLGVEVDQALRRIDRPGEISPPIVVWDGYVLIRLVEVRTVDLDTEREGIRAELMALPPNSAELSAVQRDADERAELELLLLH